MLEYNNLILIGYSGHAYVVADAVLENGFSIIGYSEKVETSFNPYNLEYLGFENEQNFIGWKNKNSFVLGIGDNQLRQKIARLIKTKNKFIKTIIHSSASVSKSATIGEGTFVSRNVSISPICKIGKYCILNTGAIVEHECVIGEAVHLAPGTVLAGNVSIGDRSFIGANSVIKQGVTIGKDVIVGAGSVVIRDIPDGKKIVGNPSREI